jgi:hypothetical protein
MDAAFDGMVAASRRCRCRSSKAKAATAATASVM